MKAVSLFCSSGIGDLGLSSNGIETVVANELLPDRAMLFQNNNRVLCNIILFFVLCPWWLL